jgi:hypothetical protein
MSIARRLDHLEDVLGPQAEPSRRAVTLLFDDEADLYREQYAPFRTFTPAEVEALRESDEVDVLAVRFVAAVDGRPA